MIRHADLIAFCPTAAKFEPGLSDAAQRFGIVTNARVRNWMVTLHHESQGFTRLEENLNYSASGLLRTFGKYFTAPQALAYAHKPEKIANRVYAGRNGNGDESSGDGWLYRGRSLTGLTFRGNYSAAGKALGLDLVAHPDLAADPQNAALIGGWFWDWKGCNPLADVDNVSGIRQRVNGGQNGIEDCLRLFEIAERIWP